MDYMAEPKFSFLKRLLSTIVLFSLMTCLSAVTVATADSKKTYKNRQYGFTLKYPSIYKIKTSGQWGFDLIRDDRIILRANIEDNAFKIFIKESKHKENLFLDFARERAKVICGADGPDGSTHCGAIDNEKQYTSANGLNCLEFYLLMTREDYSTNTKYLSKVGPIYVVDISREERPLALMIFSGYGKLASTSTELMMWEVVDTIKLVP
ncbi:MAG: hypothetical protein OEU55_12720 [Desulfobacterales bacterium]|nr:hypothetical protein [Desulfobacterales bacterium]